MQRNVFASFAVVFACFAGKLLTAEFAKDCRKVGKEKWD
jgi:hypothetical protein